MAVKRLTQRQAEAAEQINRREKRKDGEKIVAALTAGLNVLRDAIYRRIHDDVEEIVGKDSMLVPLSELKDRARTEREIEIYQVAESAATMAYFGHVDTRGDWHVAWLARLRLGEEAADPEVAERLDAYLAQGPDDRRLAFTDVLAKVLPESRQAPLVLFRLIPLCVRIVVALAFGDRENAEELRRHQATHLRSIADCRACGGRLLESGRQCPKCGNPLWTSEWMLMVD